MLPFAVSISASSSADMPAVMELQFLVVASRERRGFK